ncbi:hypothetical protein ACLKA6_018056 [Drosophila palustris]
MPKSNKSYTNGSRKVRWMCLVAILICTLLYFKINTAFLNESDRDFFLEGYFVNTSGCRMLALNPYSMKALSYLSRLEPMECTQVKLLDAKTIKGNNYLILAMPKEKIVEACDVKRISDVYCAYKVVKRRGDNQHGYSETTTFRLRNEKRQIKLKSGPTIVRIQCFGGQNKSVYHDVHFFVPTPSRQRGRTSSESRLSVMIIGIDSLSHMQFLRTMPSLAAYVKRLPHVEFWGYNRVGRNTYPNLVPLFSGLNERELESQCYNGQMNYDKCDLIWKHFKAAGYNTTYAEDTFIGGTFNYGKRGFRKQPTDFYLRPVMLEVDRFTRYSIDEQEDIHCSGSRRYADILYEFIYKMIPHLREATALLDKDYVNLLSRLRSSHILNNTLVLLMSDHGLRYGSFRSSYQGMLEESQPLLIAIYPQWLEESYPLAISNLRRNAHSLVTTFDLHATLKDLTNLSLLNDSHIEHRQMLLQELDHNMPRGINLFLPIPESRNCELAGIPSSFCLCQTFSLLDTADEKSEQAAHFVVESINNRISSYKQCRILGLQKIQEAYVLNRNQIQREVEVKVRVQTSPGKGSRPLMLALELPAADNLRQNVSSFEESAS